MPKDEFDPEDPMELVGVGLPGGDANAMARCLVEEYVQLGYDDDTLWNLFRAPFFAGLHAILLQRGDEYVAAIIREAREKLGYWRATTVRRKESHA
jgi:hypothetical protein